MGLFQNEPKTIGQTFNEGASEIGTVVKDTAQGVGNAVSSATQGVVEMVKPKKAWYNIFGGKHYRRKYGGSAFNPSLADASPYENPNSAQANTLVNGPDVSLVQQAGRRRRTRRHSKKHSKKHSRKHSKKHSKKHSRKHSRKH